MPERSKMRPKLGSGRNGLLAGGLRFGGKETKNTLRQMCLVMTRSRINI
jgi:hypothetical protein